MNHKTTETDDITATEQTIWKSYAYFISYIVWVHYSDVIMSTMASHTTGVSIVCSAVCSDASRRKYQSAVSLASVRGIHWWSMDSPHKGPVTQKMFPFGDVIMFIACLWQDKYCDSADMNGIVVIGHSQVSLRVNFNKTHRFTIYSDATMPTIFSKQSSKIKDRTKNI